MNANERENDSNALIDALRGSLAEFEAAPSLVVAFSGGGDSSALLHALAALRDVKRFDLRAIHVNHGLHADAERWEQQCRSFAEQLSVACSSIPVEVIETGDGLEAAARDARYAALFANTGADDIIVLAQHRDDQAETVLLRLLRGSGGHGLSAMKSLSRRGGRRLWRPLLELPRSTIDAYCRAHAIDPIHDPANRDPSHSRSFLRQTVMPLLRQQWPSVDAALAQSASVLAEESQRLRGLDRQNLAQAQGLDPDTLSITELKRHTAAARRALLRTFVAARDAPPIPARVLARLDDLLDATDDAGALLRWADTSLRRYRGLLHLCRDQAETTTACDWDGRAALTRLDGWRLRFDPAPKETLSLRISPRRGGERIQLAGKSHSQDLNKVLQEIGVPPWQRDRLPLLWLDVPDGPNLLAVGDLLRSSALAALESRDGCRFNCFPPDPDRSQAR